MVGAGNYAVDGNFATPAGKPWITDDFKLPVKSAQWWVTLISEQFSQPMFAHPLSFKATAKGLEMGYPGGGTTYAEAAGFSWGHTADITIGVEGMNAEAARVAGFSHASVTARWKDGTKVMEAVMSHGLPFAYYKITGGKAAITSAGKPWYDKDGTLGVTVNGKHYGVFAPSGSVWGGAGTVTSDLNGKDYLSVAVLPDNSPETLAFFRKYAFAFVKEVRVDWAYMEPNAKMICTWSAKTDIKEGTEAGTVFGLLRHQWLDASSPLTAITYKSPRGEMKVAAGPSFQTVMQFNGILPTLPNIGLDAAALKTQVSGFSGSVGGGDSYGSGKSMGRLAAMAPIADLAGDMAKRDEIVKALEKGLESWFTSGGGQQLWYNKTWSALVGYPSSFYTDTRLCDHHFHYGYFIMAAAVIAQYDPAWAAKDKWGGMVEMLIREVNSWDDADPLFARFRYFDAYEGHGWADGMGFDRGNNQESSSESMNCNAAIIQWGVHTGNKVIRDLGIFMYATEARAIEQYWFDVDGANFPTAFPHEAVGMVWSNGGAYSTWFSADVGRIHGINILPMTAASVYLGRRPDKIAKNYAEGNKGSWPDLFLQYLAMTDGDGAAQKYGGGVEAEAGDSKPHALYQIKSLQAAGKLNTDIGASVPSFNVFDKAAAGATTRTYTAFNASAAPVTVTFTDGFAMEVPAHTQLTKQGPAKAIAIRSPSRPSARATATGPWNSAAYPGRYPWGGFAAYGADGRRLRAIHSAASSAASGARSRAAAGVFLTVPQGVFSPIPAE